MSYYNQRNNQGYNNNRGGYYNGGGYRSNYRQGGNYQRQQKKRSGASFGYANGVATKPYVRGWKVDKTHGMRSFIAGPNKKTKRVTSKNGREWENWTAKVQGPHGVQLYNALYDVQKKRVYIQDLGIVLSPNGGSGGYTGPFFKRRGR